MSGNTVIEHMLCTGYTRTEAVTKLKELRTELKSGEFTAEEVLNEYGIPPTTENLMSLRES